MTTRKNEDSEHSKHSTKDYFLTTLALDLCRQNGQIIYTGHSRKGGMESFRDAVETAERLLKTVEGRKEELIHAYRLFPVSDEGGGAFFNTKGITERFKEVGWGQKMSLGTVRNWVTGILEGVQNEIDRRRRGYIEFSERHNFEDPAYSDIEGFVGRLLEDFAVPGLIGDVDHLRSRIAGVFRRMIDDATAPMLRSCRLNRESPTDALTTAAFMRFVCGYDSLEKRIEANDTSVRPYELFLFASQQGVLNDKLTKPRSALSPDFVPEPKYESSLSILVAHGGASQALKDWDREDKERQQRWEELEKTTSGGGGKN